MTTDLKTAIDELAARSAARLADIERREQNVQQAEADLAVRRRDLDIDTSILAERLACVTQAEAAIDAKVAAGAAAARQAADKARAEYERLVAELRAVLK